MRTARSLVCAFLGLALLGGCGMTPKVKLSLAKYNPVKVYNAPYPKVYEAAKQAMAVDKYELEVDASDPKAGNGMLVTGYITTQSPDQSWTDEKGQKKRCQVKYLIHADIQALSDGRTQLDLRVPETTEFYKTGLGPVWEKTNSMSWRGQKIQDAMEAILAGKPIPGSRPAPPPAPAKQGKNAGK